MRARRARRWRRGAPGRLPLSLPPSSPGAAHGRAGPVLTHAPAGPAPGAAPRSPGGGRPGGGGRGAAALPREGGDGPGPPPPGAGGVAPRHGTARQAPALRRGEFSPSRAGPSPPGCPSPAGAAGPGHAHPEPGKEFKTCLRYSAYPASFPYPFLPLLLTFGFLSVDVCFFF